MGNFLSHKKLLRLHSSFIIHSILLVVLWLLTFSAAAQTKSTWIGVDSDWYNPGNWSTSEIPGVNTKVIIGKQTNAPIIGKGEPIIINSLTIEGGTLKIGNRERNQNVTVINDVVINAINDEGGIVHTGSIDDEGRIVHTGSLMAVYGDWINNGYFTQDQGSTIEVYGNWTTGIFTHNNGTIILAGDSNTLLSGSAIFGTLIINKATADNTVTLESDITTNSLNMVNGLLITSVNKVTLNNVYLESSISETEDAYVTGVVETQRTLTMDIPEDFGGIGITITTKTDLAGLTTVTRTTGIAVGQNKNSILRSFVVMPNGSNIDLNAIVEMQYFNHELNDIKKEELAFYVSPDGESWNLQLEGQKTENRMILTGVNTLQHYTLGGINAPLPVELVYFDVTISGKEAVLKWATAMEQDNKGFAMEVSTDGHIFRQFGFVESNSVNSFGIQKYSFTDTENGKTGVRYYRLRQVDNNGTESIYSIKALDFGSIVSTAVIAYPNPFSNSLTLAVDAPGAGTAKITMHDLVGKQLFVKEQHVQAGATTIPLNAEQVTLSGVYIITLELNGHVRRVKVIKE